MCDLLVLLAGQANDFERLANILFRNLPQRLQDLQIFLAGQMAIIRRGFDQGTNIL